MQCDGTPDPTVLPEINTFISLWHDDQQHLDVEHTMTQTNLVLSLINELHRVINSIPPQSPELQHVPVYKKVRSLTVAFVVVFLSRSYL
jgi:cancer susceptibility candidate protein 1